MSYAMAPPALPPARNSMRLSVQVLPLAPENAHGPSRAQAMAHMAARKFALPVSLDDTFGELWPRIEERYKKNYLLPHQASAFTIYKLQDAYDCDLDVDDTVRSIFEGEADASMRMLKVVPAFIDRDFSVPPTSNLRPISAQKRTRDFDLEQANKRLCTAQSPPPALPEDQSPLRDQPIFTTESEQGEHDPPPEPAPRVQSRPRSTRSHTQASLVFLNGGQTGAPEFAPAIKRESPEPGDSSPPRRRDIYDIPSSPEFSKRIATPTRLGSLRKPRSRPGSLKKPSRNLRSAASTPKNIDSSIQVRINRLRQLCDFPKEKNDTLQHDVSLDATPRTLQKPVGLISTSKAKTPATNGCSPKLIPNTGDAVVYLQAESTTPCIKPPTPTRKGIKVTSNSQAQAVAPASSVLKTTKKKPDSNDTPSRTINHGVKLTDSLSKTAQQEASSSESSLKVSVQLTAGGEKDGLSQVQTSPRQNQNTLHLTSSEDEEDADVVEETEDDVVEETEEEEAEAEEMRHEVQDSLSRDHSTQQTTPGEEEAHHEVQDTSSRNEYTYDSKHCSENSWDIGDLATTNGAPEAPASNQEANTRTTPSPDSADDEEATMANIDPIQEHDSKSRSVSPNGSARSSPALARPPARFISHSPTPEGSDGEEEEDDDDAAEEELASSSKAPLPQVTEEGDVESDSESTSSDSSQASDTEIPEAASAPATLPTPSSTNTNGLRSSPPQLPLPSKSTSQAPAISRPKIPTRTPIPLPPQKPFPATAPAAKTPIRPSARPRNSQFSNLKCQLEQVKSMSQGSGAKGFDPRTMRLEKLINKGTASGKGGAVVKGFGEEESSEESSESSSSSDDSD